MPEYAEQDIGNLLHAVDFAARKHRGQRRKGSNANPYINHPLGVAHLLWDRGDVREIEVLIAAVLHDTVEDTETTLDEIREKFGHPVAELVDEVTDDKSLPKTRRKELQIEHARRLSRGAALIKLADKIYNVHDILNNPPRDWQGSRKLEYLKWAQTVVGQLPVTENPLRSHFEQLVDEGFRKIQE